MNYRVAALDIHKRVLMAVVADVSSEAMEFRSRRFGAGAQERQHLAAWLAQQGVSEIVMESTAQYWKPVWLDLELDFEKLHLAQAQSNRAPRGRKHDFGDAQRLLRRFVAGELILSFVPDSEQRGWRTMMRTKVHLIQDRVMLQNQMEGLLEEMRIKLSSVVSELLGLSGRRILAALAEGETDPARLAALGDFRLRCGQPVLLDALTGQVRPMHQKLLKLYLERLYLLDRQILQLDEMAGEAMRQHKDAVVRLAAVPGFGPDSAQQIIAEVGPAAATFASPGELASWIGVCPGKDETAEQNRNSRCPKGNKFARRILTQAAQAAARKQGSVFQAAFRRWLPRLGYQAAIWALAHKLCRLLWLILHNKVTYVEQGAEGDPRAKKRRAQKMLQQLRRMGYKVDIAPLVPAPAQG